ncbi:MAG: transglutaminase-like domain-containing protein [Nanoarchaeota archaeon]
MNRRIVVCLCSLILLLTLQVSALEPEDIIYSSESLLLEHRTSSSIYTSYASAQARLMNISARVDLRPLETFRQDMLSLQIDPEPVFQQGSTVMLVWQEPDAGDLDFSISSRVRTHNVFLPVKEKVAFPLENLPEGIRPFLQEAANIDITADIRSQANKVVQGQTDYYLAVHALVDWVEENIEYSLNTVTADVSLPASWVYQEREGVCDELTALFIAMCRSVGIPARFVSGISYTTSSLFDDKWSSHAWAEVYFPEVGWVPFDITYRQFGIVDASHIHMRHAVDANSTQTLYDWSGFDLDNVRIKLDVLDFDTRVLDAQGTFRYPVEISAEMFSGRVGFDSFGRIDVQLKNQADHYLSVPLRVHSTEEVRMEDDAKTIALKPGESREVSFYFQLIGDFDADYQYTMPFQVVSHWAGVSDQLELQIDRHGPVFSERSVRAMGAEERLTELRENVTLECPAAADASIDARILVTCTVINRGNVYYEEVQLCSRGSCSRAPLGIQQQQNISVPLTYDKQGTYMTAMTLRAGQTDLQETVEVSVQDRPFVELTDLQYPRSVKYREPFSISAVIRVSGTVHNMNARMDNGFTPVIWNIGTTKEHQKLVANLTSSFLQPGVNDVLLLVQYQDKDGEAYRSEQEITVELTDVSWWASLRLGLTHWIEKLAA